MTITVFCVIIEIKIDKIDENILRANLAVKMSVK